MNANPNSRPLYELPDSMTPIVESIGFSAAVSVAHVWGGADLYIPMPKKLDDSHPIMRMLGEPLARRLAQRLGGQTVSIPVCRQITESQRTVRILTMAHDGKPIPEIARTLCLTERAVRLIIARNRPSPAT